MVGLTLAQPSSRSQKSEKGLAAVILSAQDLRVNIERRHSIIWKERKTWKICQNKKSLKPIFRRVKLFERKNILDRKGLIVKKEKQDWISIEGAAEQTRIQAGAELGQT